jgi:hypothetical protein
MLGGKVMKRTFLFPGSVIYLVAVLLLAGAAGGEMTRKQLPLPAGPGLYENFGNLPLHFEANQGQTDEQARFLSRGQGYALFLTREEAVLVLSRFPKPAPDRASGASPFKPGTSRGKLNETAVLRLKVAGASPEASMSGLREVQGKVHYFKGKDPARWRRNVPLYEAVRYQAILPGIDLVFYGREGCLEYDFVVSPGADPRAIKLEVKGPDKLHLDPQGNLLMKTGTFEWTMRAPLIYQERDGRRTVVPGGFALLGDNCLGFRLGPYDTRLPLVIDPVLDYSTLLGGSQGELGRGIAVDAAGCAYVSGQTASLNFPTIPGSYDTAAENMNGDIFVTKFNPAGSGLVYSTYIGGTDTDWAHALILDASNNAYVTGYTRSFDFPTTPGAYSRVKGGGTSNIEDAFVLKLNPTGSALVFSTFLGGDQVDWGEGIALDAAGKVYVTGITYSTVFPTTANAFQKIYQGNGDVFVTKLNAAGSALVYSTLLGGALQEYGFGIAVDSANCAYVVGQTNSDNFPTTVGSFQSTYKHGNMDAFVTKLKADGSGLIYSTYLGGSGWDFGHGIVLDGQKYAYVTGGTASMDFPTRNPYQADNQGPVGAFQGIGDAFVAKLNPTGAKLVFSTFLGGAQQDEGHGIALDPQGNIHVTGLTWSYDFPLANPVQAQHQQGATGVNSSDAFITKLNPAASKLIYSTYLGGIGYDWGHAIAVDSKGAAYVIGDTNSSNFPVTANAFQKTQRLMDAFVAKIKGEGGAPPAIMPLLLD